MVKYSRAICLVGNLLVFDYRGVDQIAAEHQFELKKWYNVVVTFEKSTCECIIYIDGKRQKQKNYIM
eukprot:UN33574